MIYHILTYSNYINYISIKMSEFIKILIQQSIENLFDNTNDNIIIFNKIVESIIYIHDDLLNDRTINIDKLTFSDYYNTIIEILSIRTSNDITSDKIQSFIRNGTDPLDPITSILEEYEEMREKTSLGNDNTELDKFLDVINKLKDILPYNTNLYELYIFILQMMKFKLDI